MTNKQVKAIRCIMFQRRLLAAEIFNSVIDDFYCQFLGGVFDDTYKEKIKLINDNINALIKMYL